MSAESEQQKNVVKAFIELFKTLESELVAHKIVIHALKREVDGVENALVIARNSPELKKTMDDKYDHVLQKMLSSIDLESVNQDLIQWLRAWQPQGPVQ